MTYYYEHTNGKIISKPDIVVDMSGGPDIYFHSDFVKRWWHEDENKLKPCPFCGSEDIDPEGIASFKEEYRNKNLNWDEHANEETIEHKPACNVCGATTNGDWNKRA